MQMMDIVQRPVIILQLLVVIDFFLIAPSLENIKVSDEFDIAIRVREEEKNSTAKKNFMIVSSFVG